MPRYYFNLYNDLDVMDDEGVELADANAAEVRGLANAREMAALSLQNTGRIDLRHRVDVVDDAGRVLRSIPFREVVEVVG